MDEKFTIQILKSIFWLSLYSDDQYLLCSDFQNITNELMCADVLEEGSFCIGDGGGPLVTKNNIVSKQYFLVTNVCKAFSSMC